MARAQKRRKDSSEQLELYRRIRKPMPPPERVIPDKRRKVVEREAEREAREGKRRASEPRRAAEAPRDDPSPRQDGH